MDFKDNADLTLKLIDKIEKLWNLFFISNLGVAVWIFADENSMDIVLTSIATITYLAYSIMNLKTLVRGYVFLELSIEEMQLSLKNNGVESERVHKKITDLKYKSRIAIAIISYTIGAVVILFLLWTDTNYKF